MALKQPTTVVHIVFVCEFGKWNYRELAKLPQEEQDAFHKHLEFYDRSMSKDAAANQDHATALIMDFDGFEMGHFATSKGNLFTRFPSLDESSVFCKLNHICACFTLPDFSSEAGP